MMIRKPMSADAKERLRLAGLKKKEEAKGRATLKGYEWAGWCAAADEWKDGRLFFPHENLFTSRGQFDGRDIRLPRFRWTYSREEAADDRVTRNATSKLITFVALKHCRPDQEASLREMFGAVPVVEWVYGGPSAGRFQKATWVFPAASVVRFVWSLWPGEKEDWGGKVGKYLHGYTAGIVRKLAPDTTKSTTPAYAPTAPAGFMDAARAGVHGVAMRELLGRGILKITPQKEEAS